MKKITSGIVITLAIGLLAGMNHAATPQLMVDHTLTGYHKGASTVTLYYRLRVSNPGSGVFKRLSLSMLPLPPLVAKGTVVKVGDLGSQQTTDVSLQVVTPAVLDPKQFSRNGLLWTGKYLDGNGEQVEFRLKSRPAGAS